MDTCHQALARTGPHTAELAVAGIALAVAGLLLVVAARRIAGGPARAGLLGVAVLALGGLALASPPLDGAAHAATSCVGSTTPPAAGPGGTTATSTTSTTSTTAPAAAATAPRAADDTASGMGEVTADVLANDDRGAPAADLVDTDFGPVGVDLPVPGGTFRLDPDGTATLVADDPVVGAAFGTTYTIANDGGASSARVILTVDPLPPSPPVASDDALSGIDVDRVSGNVLDNDDLGFPDGDIVAVGGGEVGVTTALPGGATFRLDADGTATFSTPDPIGAGSYTTTYTVQNAGGSSTATITAAILVST